MADPARLRDSTQIVLPTEVVEDWRADLEAAFTVTIFTEGEHARIIGSPVVIKEVGEYLSRRGVRLR